VPVRPLPTLRTPRLLLRLPTHDDAPALLSLFGDPAVVRYMTIEPLADLEAARAFVDEIRAGVYSGELLQWAVCTSGDDRLVGTCTLFAIDRRHRRAEIGFALAPTSRGRGLMREAVRAVIEHAFTALELHRLEADADPRNAPSLRLLESLGFRHEGRLRERYHQLGEWQDAALFGLLRREWRPA
jgi:RimJ/RimL family protein N-acetyltransferase